MDCFDYIEMDCKSTQGLVVKTIRADLEVLVKVTEQIPDIKVSYCISTYYVQSMTVTFYSFHESVTKENSSRDRYSIKASHVRISVRTAIMLAEKMPWPYLHTV